MFPRSHDEQIQTCRRHRAHRKNRCATGIVAFPRPTRLDKTRDSGDTPPRYIALRSPHASVYGASFFLAFLVGITHRSSKPFRGISSTGNHRSGGEYSRPH